MRHRLGDADGRRWLELLKEGEKGYKVFRVGVNKSTHPTYRWAKQILLIVNYGMNGWGNTGICKMNLDHKYKKIHIFIEPYPSEVFANVHQT